MIVQTCLIQISRDDVPEIRDDFGMPSHVKIPTDLAPLPFNDNLQTPEVDMS